MNRRNFLTTEDTEDTEKISATSRDFGNNLGRLRSPKFPEAVPKEVRLVVRLTSLAAVLCVLCGKKTGFSAAID